VTIVQALDQVMPEGSQVHLFGVKSGALAALAPYAHRIASSDSMAWDAQVRREMPTGRTQEIRARAMAAWHAKQTRSLHVLRQRPVVRQEQLFDSPERERTLLDIAQEATGAALADLHGSNDLSYLDVKWLAAHSAYVVEALIHNRGAGAFEQEQPADDFGLGIVYSAVRDALVDAGHLEVSNEECSDEQPAPAN